MAQLGENITESLDAELAEIGRSMRSSFRTATASLRRSSAVSSTRYDDDENELIWAAVERLPTFERVRTSVFDHWDGDNGSGEQNKRKVIDVTKLGALERHLLIENLIKNIESDNLRLLQKQRERIDRVNVKLPTIEVRFKDLSVEAECEVVQGKPLPTLWNTTKSILSDLIKVPGVKTHKAKIHILKDISGIIKPSRKVCIVYRMTLVLGLPGCGKTTFLKALSGKLDKSLKVTGEISYNGFGLEEFVPEKTSAYISQYDLHIPEMTVRETMDFSACFQGAGNRAEIMKEVSQREKQAGIIPDPEIDTYMKAISLEGLDQSLQTDYILKIMGLDLCADTMVGDAMRRGISGGEKKRLTTGEMIVGPTTTLFMDEISSGLDSSTTFQIATCLQQFAHITESTVVVSLLQPAPETYELFDDIILMAEGKIVYQGPCNHILNFFEECGFKCPERKGVADFLQEVLSRKDQGQYWFNSNKIHSYVSVDQFSKSFKVYQIGQSLSKELSKPYDMSQSHKNALSFNKFSLSNWELLKACVVRELLLMKRNSFVYILKITQIGIAAIITATVFIRTHMEVDMIHSNYYLGSLFFALISLMVNGFPEMAMTVSRLPVFYRQRDCYFYPAWAYAIPATILKIPISLVESLVWTSITYYAIGYSPESVRFFRQFLLLFCVHQMSLSLFRFVASYFQTAVAATISGTMCLIVILLFGGFVIPKPYLPGWLSWAFWISPLSYTQIGLAVNEFHAPRWQKPQVSSANMTIGQQVLTSRGLNYQSYFYWVSIATLILSIFLLNVAFTLSLTFRRPVGVSRVIISLKKLSQIQGTENGEDTSHPNSESPAGSPVRSTLPKRTGKMANLSEKMVLPFVPLAMTFQNVNYYVDTPLEMREQVHAEKRLQLLHNITGAFQPGILSALMGVSGAGKTTLLDVLAGRKTGGTIEGDIRIGGYPKRQETFARISGYCEQFDIHSPQITVEESVMYSAWLRLPPQIDGKTRSKFVHEVLETIELDSIKDSLVGIQGVSGLSTEQRKRLTIAVELVSNPSIIFMDEPTSGLDARAAAIVMRAVKNVAETGRTVVCTIHQPSIDIFEAFDELILMRRGGELIYTGPTGKHSSKVIEYFEGISGVPKIRDNYNPATWMLEVTSMSMEKKLGVDFAKIYTESSLDKDSKELVKRLSTPPLDSNDLSFSTRYPQKFWVQFKACIWKQSLSYWRSPSYNMVRIFFILVASIIFGIVFWQRGKTLNNQQDLFNTLAIMYLATIFTGINNCSPVLPFVSIERTVLYRENFAGMYSPWAYSLAQVAIEIPYVLIEVVLFMIIAYPAIGYYWTASKLFWFFYTMLCTLLYYVYLGMLLVSLTPNVQVASIMASVCYTLFNLFSGFIVPGPQIPKWWIWLYYLNPMSWTLNGLFSSQYGDVQKEMMVFGETKSIASFLKDYFGFHHNLFGVVAGVLLAFPFIYATLFAYFIGKLNFQTR
ncbi:ABC transporter G family member 41-like isoform X1 [Musa acuminata AAA Group]|uniref:ABC transporter G family member 41-like isoform X1 n=1 Tax=Musa acuminata AAA Group TaxID=214697 RepID=UPI0031DA47ED